MMLGSKGILPPMIPSSKILLQTSLHRICDLLTLVSFKKRLPSAQGIRLTLVRQAAFLLLSVILSQNMYHYNEIITSPFAFSGSSSASMEMLNTKVT